jgi:hypothetical protein
MNEQTLADTWTMHKYWREINYITNMT